MSLLHFFAALALLLDAVVLGISGENSDLGQGLPAYLFWLHFIYVNVTKVLGYTSGNVK